MTTETLVTTSAATGETEAARNEFHITTDDAANWLLRKLANLEAEKQRVKAQAETLLKQLDSDAERLRFLYGPELQAYARQKLEVSGNRRKSVAFLQGTCSFRTVAAAVKIIDPKAALEHAKEHLPAYIQTVETLDGAAYRQYVETTGERLPGVEVLPERETFAVKFGKAED